MPDSVARTAAGLENLPARVARLPASRAAHGLSARPGSTAGGSVRGLGGFGGAGCLANGFAGGPWLSARPGSTAGGSVRGLGGFGGSGCRASGSAEVRLGAILLAPARYGTLGVTEFSQCMNGPLRIRDPNSRPRPVRGGSSYAALSGGQMTSYPLADNCSKLSDKYRNGFHTKNIPGVSQE
jgi:hypothetical protein